MFEIGIDIVENKRIEKSISDDFIKKILTQNEINQYNNKIGKKKTQFLCGRFAAKEAIIKVINKNETPGMYEIEITNDKNGAPAVRYKNYNIKISIAHENNYTVANALLIK